MGVICESAWMYQLWDKSFIQKYNQSIEYLELYAVTAAVLTWIHKYKNRRIILFCDNQSVVDMINLTTTSCKNCMVLIGIIVLRGLIDNVRVFARHVKGSKNIYADNLSRDKVGKFKRLCIKNGKEFNKTKEEVPDAIWPIEKN